MFFILSYKLDSTHPSSQQTKVKTETILSAYEHMNCLDGFIIIRISNQDEWEIIRKNFTEVAKESGGSMFFIMSPIITSGRFNGWMKQLEWAEINKLTLE